MSALPFDAQTFAAQTFLVTGAAQGIGRAITVGLAAGGARVIACDTDSAALAGTAEQAGHTCVAAQLDVTDAAAIASLIAAIGPIHGLVHSAGGVVGQVGRPVDEVPLADWQAIQDVNLTAAFLLARAVAPGMKSRGSGRMVMISSGAGIDISLTGIQSYASAKAGQLGLVRQLAHELGPWGITVNAVAPGFVRSNPTTERQWQSLGPDGQRDMIERIALRRLGNADDIASAVLFLASDRASWITGQVLRVDGGR